MPNLEELASRVEAGRGTDNALDVLIEVALFEPDEEYVSARPNAAGTKVIYTLHGGIERTYWAQEWTADRKDAASALRSRALLSKGEKGE